MTTILDVINKTAPFFEKNGVESPRLTIELLLAHVLQVKRLQLYLEFERVLTDDVLTRLRELVKRRANGEPLQYITGATEFYGLEFTVDPRVLIPRPETELLVEHVIKRLTADGAARRPYRIIDVGTGSGCIAITFAKNLPEAEVLAIDASAEALAVAQANAVRHGVEKRIRFIEGDLLSGLPDGSVVEAIVSNPPYIATGELATLPREVRDFEPVQALTAGADGLEVIRRLVTSSKTCLSPSGFMAIEIGAGQAAAVQDLFAAAQYDVSEVIKDLQGHERVIVARLRD